MASTHRSVSFPGSTGERLAARLELPARTPRAVALFAHCFTCSKDIPAATRISRALCAHGYAVLRFDFTGLGGSDGDFANTNFSSNVGDLVAAAGYLRDELGAPTLLVGHSLGGAAVLMAADEIPEVRAVAVIGAPSDPAHLKHLFEQDLEEIARQGSARVTIAGRPFTIQSQFLADLEEQAFAERVRKSERALLILHAPQDDVVPIDHARRLYMAARHPKSFVALDGADHLLGRLADAEFAASMIAAWSARYLPPVQPADPEVPEGDVWVTELNGGLTQEIATREHVLLADEPRSLGGAGRGPTPYDLLLAALGACTTMTLRMYAKHKGWPLEGVAVALRHAKIHARDCESCEEETGKIDRIERELVVEGELTAEQRARLLEIADRCPVHRTLFGGKEIPTRLVERLSEAGSAARP